MGEVVVQWLHITAAVVWLGGKIFASLALNPVLRLKATSEQRLELLGSLGGRFKYLSWGSLAVLVITGVINTLAQVSGLEELLGSRFGNLLLAKVSIVIAMVALSAGHTVFLTPRLREKAQDENGFERTKKTVVLVARANILLGLTALLLAVML